MVHKIKKKEAEEWLKTSYLFGYMRALERTKKNVSKELLKFGDEYDKLEFKVSLKNGRGFSIANVKKMEEERKEMFKKVK
jgi:hypothetical protein